MVEVNVSKYLTQRLENRIQIPLTIKSREGCDEFFRSHVQEFLDYLIADAPFVFYQCCFNKLVSFLLFHGMSLIKRANYDISVKKIFIFHLIHLLKKLFQVEHNLMISSRTHIQNHVYHYLHIV